MVWLQPGFCGPAIGVTRPSRANSLARPRYADSVTRPRPASRRAGLTVRCGIVRPERYTSQDWKRNLLNLPYSSVLRRIRSHLLFNFVGACGVTALYQFAPGLIVFHLSVLPHQLLGTAASLLLVFRTNAAYDRFWEGRKLWGTTVNRCRNLVSCADVYLKGQQQRDRVIYLVVAFAFIMQQHLQGKVNIEELPFELAESDKAAMQADGNKPFRIARMLRDEIDAAFKDKGGEPDIVSLRMRLEEDVTTLIDVLGACERIIKTPVPLSYSRHTSRFLSVYGFTLPFILIQQDSYWMVLSVLMVTWALFAIEEIGHVIEDPFTGKEGSLPLDAICTTILGDSREVLGRPMLDAKKPKQSAVKSVEEAVRSPV
mmetsp:Transcript_4252/g.12799  ORF Transcript_4252/g.12799 Transcript_4252/m.12799 type:complete len:371 (-) Transcript_4252:111-1223(-)